MAVESSDSAGGKQTMEALGEFLQGIKRSVEHLCERHTLASLQASQQRRPVGLSAFSMPPASQKGSHHPMSDDDVGKADEAPNSSAPYTSTGLDESLLQSTVAPSREVAPATCRTLSEPQLEHAMGHFLTDVKKTVDTWCSRYHLLADGKISFDTMPQPLHSNMQVVDQLGFGANQDFCAARDSDSSHVRDNQGSHTCAQTGTALQMNRAKQAVAGYRKSPTISRAYQNRARASGSSPQVVMGSMETTQLSHQDRVATQEPMPSESEVENRKMNMNHTSATMEAQNVAHCENVDVNVEKGSLNESDAREAIVGEGAIVKFGSSDKLEKKPTDGVKSPVETDELTIRRYQYKVEVVESPDWLPKGWITELKTRSTGGSAGCKDKYYFDPVSKRRCRSQKEVFCLLETGKLGRYKRRQKPQPTNRLLGIDLEQEISNPSEMQTASKRGVSGTRTISFSDAYAQDNSPSPLATYPGTGHRGVVGSTYLPYRPGQTSQFLYESMANLVRSGMDQYHYVDPSSSKPSGDRNNASREWFFGNAEGLTRPLLDMDKSDNGVGGQGFVRGRHGAEGAPKRARKSSKKSAS